MRLLSYGRCNAPEETAIFPSTACRVNSALLALSIAYKVGMLIFNLHMCY